MSTSDEARIGASSHPPNVKVEITGDATALAREVRAAGRRARALTRPAGYRPTLPAPPAVLELEHIPAELVEQLEHGMYLGTCDWGHCTRDQIGWALCADPQCTCPEGWLAICGPCSRGILPPIARRPGMRTWHPVGEVITFDDVRSALRADLRRKFEVLHTTGGPPAPPAARGHLVSFREFALGLVFGLILLVFFSVAAATIAGWLA